MQIISLNSRSSLAYVTRCDVNPTPPAHKTKSSLEVASHHLPPTERRNNPEVVDAAMHHRLLIHLSSTRHTKRPLPTCAGNMVPTFGLWIVLLALCLSCLAFLGSAYCTRTGDLYTSTISQCRSYSYNLACCENTGLCDAYPAAAVITCPSSTSLPACCT